MAGCARREIVREGEIGTYHCWSKCTQRAFLCGQDRETGINFDYRREWIESLLQYQAGVFSLEELGWYVHDPESGHVDLSAWRGTSEDLALLGDLSMVTHLRLGRVDDESLRTISRLAQLQELSLSGPSVTDEGLAPLSRLPNLEVLDLGQLNAPSDTLTNRALEHLRGSTKLRRLTVIGNNSITKEALNTLWDDLPNLSEIQSPVGGTQGVKGGPFRRGRQ